MFKVTKDNQKRIKNKWGKNNAAFCFPAVEIQREERHNIVMIEKEEGEAKSFRKNCHMARAEQMWAWLTHDSHAGGCYQ